MFSALKNQYRRARTESYRTWLHNQHQLSPAIRNELLAALEHDEEALFAVIEADTRR